MISIILPFRNAISTLTACLSSISAQTFPHFEIIAIDDHSEDPSADLVTGFPDSRIRSVPNAGDGLVDALNTGLACARYPMIARMDADDLMRPRRLEIQFEFLQKNPDICLVASQVSLFPECLLQKGYRHYIDWQNQVLTSEDIMNEIYVESPLAHPSVMFRKHVVQEVGGYQNGDFPEDYELWLRLLSRGYSIAKVPTVMLDWRESAGRTSRVDPRYSRFSFDKLRAAHLTRDPRLQTQRPLLIWGAGRKTRKRAKLTLQKGIEAESWIDIDPKKIGQLLDGIPVISPTDILNMTEKPFILIYVTNHGAREEISEYLESAGFKKGLDYLAVG